MNLVFDKLRKLGHLTSEDESAIADVFTVRRTYPPNHEIVAEGEKPGNVYILLQGFVCRQRILRNGQRQIIGLVLPGEIFDLQGLFFGASDHAVSTISQSRVAVTSVSRFHGLAHANERLAPFLYRDAAVEGAIFREWIVSMGRRSAYSRTAHLLCEVAARMENVGLLRDGSCDFPLTQRVLGDTLGLSLVHINRVMKKLRDRGLARLHAGRLTIGDWDGLAEAGEFDPVYLHLRDELTLQQPALAAAPAMAAAERIADGV